MRTALKTYNNIRCTFIAEFKRYGTSVISGVEYDTVLLLNIKNTFGDFLTDHVWIREAKKFKKLKLNQGDKVMFSAIVRQYQRGYLGGNTQKDESKCDYKLMYLEKIKKIS